MASCSGILLLSYKFPPYEEVGARRWALFYNEFTKYNIHLHVVCYDWPERGNSYKLKDERNVYRMRDPVTCLINYKGVFKKQLNRIGYLIMKLFKVTDEAYFFYMYNFSQMRKTIEKHNINCVIATGGPFSGNYFAARLKELYPSIELIQDFRDTWTQVFFWEYPERANLQDLNYLKQLEMERYSISRADAIVNVCEKESELMKNSHPKIDSNKFHIILNGFDLNDFSNEMKQSKVFFSEEFINIVHFGTLSFGRDKEFFNFLNASRELLVNRNIKFFQYGKIDDTTRNLITGDEVLNKIVFFEAAVPPDRMHVLMAQCDIHLVVNDVVFYYTMGSKFYDAILHRKPILLISKSSKLSELVNKYHLGWHTDNSVEMNKNVINTLVTLNDLENFSYSEDFNASEYSVQNRALEYIDLINKLF